MAYLLVATLLAPLVGAIALPARRGAARAVALAASLVVLGLAVALAAGYTPGSADYAAVDWPWFGPDASGDPPAVDIRFSLALDGLSLWLFALSALLVVVAVLISWEAIDAQAPLFYRLLLLLETGMLGVFAARDILLFYVFFEFTLIPLFFLIGIWGSAERRRAAVKFFLFTLAGSVLAFLGLLAIVLWDAAHPIGAPAGWTMTFSIPELSARLAARPLDSTVQFWIFLALVAGFAVKVPLFPLHTWLPLAHVEAPAAGSVLLAGVLLKVGSYGFVRFCLPMTPQATAAATPWLLAFSLAGILYGALVALAQRDMKRLIAYSSVSHLGFAMLGVFAANRLGLQGGVLQMVNHGLSTGGLFAVVGMIYERYHSRQIADFGGLARRLPVLAFFTVVFALSSIGLPGLNGFVGEFLLLLGMFQRAWAETPGADPLAWPLRAIAVGAVAGVVLGAWYMLWWVERLLFGPVREPSTSGARGAPSASGEPTERDATERADHMAAGSASAIPDGSAAPRDLSLREVAALAPLVVMIVWIGVQPGWFLARMAPSLDPIADTMDAAVSDATTRRCFKPIGAGVDSATGPAPRHAAAPGPTTVQNADEPPGRAGAPRPATAGAPAPGSPPGPTANLTAVAPAQSRVSEPAR